MILKALLFAIFVFVLAFIISLAVAGIIKLIFMSVHRGEAKKIEAK